MDKEQERFLNELLNDYKIEASEHYHAIVNGLVGLEKNLDISTQHSEIEIIFREIHSLKGASRAVNLLDIEKLCMRLENIFNSLKKGEAKLFPPMFDAFYKATDLLNLLLNDVNENKQNAGNYNLLQVLKNLEFAHRNSLQPKKENTAQIEVDQKRSYQQKVEEENTQRHKEAPIQETQKIQEVSINTDSQNKEKETVRISTAKLYNLLRQSEELISIKSSLAYFTAEFQNIFNQFSNWNRKTDEKTIISENSDLLKFNEEFAISNKDFRKKHEDALYQLNKEMVQFQHIAKRMIDDLVLDTKTTLLFPFSSMLGIFPKIVRDLSKESSKDIDIDIIGDKIEIDRRILEEIKDPLIHLIRNCIDHGIETANERKRKGKPINGKIEIKISQNIDRNISLSVNDDGAGIDKEKILNTAIKQGLFNQKEIEKLSDKEIYALIFKSGISTSPFITDISGRGLGMAIVAEKVEKLGGSIEMDTAKDIGTSFIISLPQTLATFRGVLINTADQYFIIPSYSVEKSIRIAYSEIHSVESKKTICYKNETIALTVLSDVLNITRLKKRKNADEYLYLLILNSAQKKIAFVVDHILGEQEGIVKNLGLQLPHVKNIAGATILGNGKVVPIIHPSELMESASTTHISLDESNENLSSSENTVQKNILVAEDSITIRTLLRNFIENAGFTVKTAVDGMEAYNLLQNEHFDLVVSDIEMPRMNGFEFTAKIREDKKHADLPVVLVTALETADDKQRGMEVGANAYIVKSSFEKSNLIETIQRLL